YSTYEDFDRATQQGIKDAYADQSCPGILATCNPYADDCGGLSLDTGTDPSGSPSTKKRPPGYDPYPGASLTPTPVTNPPHQEFWPMVPFPRDWLAAFDSDSVPAIKRLLRFTTSIVNYNASAPHMSEYTLAEDSTAVLVTANYTPIGGALHDAYNYF